MSPRRRAGNTTLPTDAWPPPQREVASADGTVIRAYWSPVPEEASATVPTVVLAADLAESVPEVWRPQVEYLGTTDMRFVAWEYRGTRRVGAVPPSKRYDVAAHLEDLCAVLQSAGVGPDEPFSIIGSGVGVRLALEAAQLMPQRVSGLVLIGGAAGWRYQWLCRASWLAAVIARQAVDHAASKRRSRQLQASVFAALTQGVDQVMQLAEMSLLELHGSDADSKPFEALDAIAASLRELGTQPVLEQAGQIKQPALVLCGERDPRMPSTLAHQLARRLEHSRVVIVPRSTSRLAFELPDLVNLELERFFADLKKA
jgi:3-oxoadipate enol-lactonase